MARIAGRGWIVGVALLGLLALAAGVRASGHERVFVGDERVAFTVADAWYHAHRSVHSFHRFPDVLWFDGCINHPDGSVVLWAPLYDWVVGGVARATGDSVAHFERVAAWSPVAFGVLALLPVFALGRLVRGPELGLGAALLYALAPLPVQYARIGNLDHHAAVAAGGALLVWLYAAILASPGRRLAVWFAALALTRVYMVLVWTGSLLYLGIGEVALVATGCLLARRDLLRGQAISAAASAGLLAPLVAAAPTPTGGPWSAVELSWVPVVSLACAALIPAAFLAWEARTPSRVVGVRLVRVAVVGALLVAGLALVPGLVDGVLRPARFLGGADAYNEQVLENFPIFYDPGGFSWTAAETRLGGLHYLLPLAPLAFGLAARRVAAPARVYLAVWSAVLGVLTLLQFRYANDWAPAGCVGIALLLAWVGDGLRRVGLPRALATATVACAGVAVIALGVHRFHVPFARETRAALARVGPGGDRALTTIEGTQLRFLERVGDLTPEAGNCAAAGEPVPRGVLAHPSVSPALFYVAERASPAANFGPYTGAENYAGAMAFLSTESEAEALALVEQLQTPYVITAEEGWAEPVARIVARLHREDGSAQEAEAHLGRFRLLDEGPEGGLPLSAFFSTDARQRTPYKLFEVVEGALLEVPAAPGEEATASLRLRTPGGRAFRFEARGRAEPDGFARIRVPYPAERKPEGLVTRRAARGSRVEARGRWQVHAGENRWRLPVSEAAVEEGEVIRLDPARARPTPARPPPEPVPAPR